jgi:hypothetical protein
MLFESIATSLVEDENCVCDRCGDRMRRLARKGFLQSKLFPVFGFYPWECFTCRDRKLLRSRGTRTFHRIWDDSWIEPVESPDPPETASPGLDTPAAASTCEAYSSPETTHSQAVPLADA